MKKQPKVEVRYTEKVGSSGPFRAVVALNTGLRLEAIGSTRHEATKNVNAQLAQVKA